ncbi:MAG TPA: phospho-N-acetylmuramoyl-pentapeptide-transferase [Candidatus Saccharimonadales bacterium]|nr:phospho-N-acetylmuramoyl-pentapeptide-transferase [Candidatus Saccharimonadales bacterium]
METLQIAVETETLIRILLLGFMGFLVSMLVTPVYTTLAYSGQWWKKSRSGGVSDEETMLLAELRADRQHRHVPTMAGMVTVFSVCVITILFNLSRPETWLPIAAFAGAAAIGLLDDIIDIRGKRAKLLAWSPRLRLALLTVVALIGGWFFFAKLDVSSIHIPLIGSQWEIGWLIIPLFVLVVVATASAVNISDGLDGLAGGLTATAFGIYAIIATLEQRFGVAGFCMTMVGALLSYTWFNIPPARFFMGDVGSFALGTALGVVAMLTNTVLILPIIGLVFMAEGASTLVQKISKRTRKGKKVFKLAPLHHHFEASGWPDTKVTMRFWVLGQVAGVLGLIVFLLGSYI